MDDAGTGGRRGLRFVVVAAVTGALALGACGTQPDTPRVSPAPTAPSASASPAPSDPRPEPTPTSPSRSSSTTTASESRTAASTSACAGSDLEVLPTTEGEVALTVDLGGDAAGLPSILRTLSSSGVPATFFVTGSWTRRYPDELRRIADAGHLLGNHSDTHPEFTALSATAITEELAAVETRVALITGGSTKPLFRFPFGDRDSRTIGLVNDNGYCAYRWTVDTLGWKGTSGGISTQTVVDRVLAGLRPGEIVLMHGGANPDDGSTLDADALPRVIEMIRDRGYTFTTLVG